MNLILKVFHLCGSTFDFLSLFKLFVESLIDNVWATVTTSTSMRAQVLTIPRTYASLLIVCA